MTGIAGHNFPAFNEATAELETLGFVVENPAQKGVIAGWEWTDYLRYDLKSMLDCEAVVTLPGWRASRGARLEVRVARSLEMPVFTLSNLRSRNG
jgi:hypothetical protein